MSFITAPQSSGGVTLIDTKQATAGQTLLTFSFSTAYKIIQLVGEVRFTAGVATPTLQLSSDGGATWQLWGQNTTSLVIWNFMAEAFDADVSPASSKATRNNFGAGTQAIAATYGIINAVRVNAGTTTFTNSPEKVYLYGYS